MFALSTAARPTAHHVPGAPDFTAGQECCSLGRFQSFLAWLWGDWQPCFSTPLQFAACKPKSGCLPPCQGEEEAKQGDREVWDATPMQCKNVLKIRRRKMNHHKYRKLIKRTRFLRRKVREGRLKRKQIKFEKDLKRIWLKAGLKEAPENWQTPKIYMKNK
uniref:small ribosomal subunit protein mS38 isoform 3 n=1 Tax=Rattus norvegicus TaxID=10116 RepID=UPI003AB8A68D